MKKLAFFVLLALLGSLIHAQTTDSTDCPLITAHPWFVNFETDSDCWWQAGNWIKHQSEFWGMLGCDQTNIPMALVSPALVIPSDTTGLRLYWKNFCGNGTPTYYVMVSRSNRYNLSSYDTIYTSTLESSPNLTQRNVSLTAYAGDTVYIAFYMQASNNMCIFIADVQMYNTLAPLGTLETPDFAVSTTDTLHFAMHITQGDSLSYHWHSELLDTTFITSDSTFSIVYPMAGTETLTVTVSNNYGELEQSKTFSVFSCDTITSIPWEEDFVEIGSEASYNACWEIGGYNHARPTSGFILTEEDGSEIIKGDLMISYTTGCYILSPAIVIPSVVENNLSLWIEHVHGIITIIETDDNVDTVYVIEDNSSEMRIRRRTVPLAPYAGQTVHLRFVNYSWGPAYSIPGSYIDRVRIDYDTLPVVDISGQAKTTTDSATLFTASIRRGYREGITYSWHSSLGGNTVTNTIGDSIWITYGAGLPGTEDTISVIATNTYGSDTAIHIVHVTDCTPVLTLPWRETFSDGIVCWHKPEGSNFIDAIPYPSPYLERYRFLRSTCNSDTLDSWIISKAIAIPADTSEEVILEWNVGSSNSYFVHTYEVLVSTDTNFTDTSFYQTVFFDSALFPEYFRYAQPDYTHRQISLRQFAGQTIHIALRNRPVNWVSGSCDLIFDNIAVRSTAVPIVTLSSNGSTYYYGDTATFTATLTQGNPTGITYTWHSTLLQRQVTGSNQWAVTYGLMEGIDTISVTVTNVYGNYTASMIVNSVIITHPQASIQHTDAYVTETTVFTAVLNRCVTDSLSFSWRSSLLDTAIVSASSSTSIIYPFVGTDTVTLIVSNVYGSDTAIAVVDVSPCTRRAVPYTEGFEGVTATSSAVAGYLPDCWSYNWNGSNSDNAPHVIPPIDYFINPNQSLIMMACTQTGYSNKAEVTLPRFSENLCSLSMAFDYKFQNASKGTFQVGYYNNNSFSIVQTMTPYSNNYRRDTVNFAVATVPNAQIVLRWNYNAPDVYAIAIDNIEVFHDNTYLTPIGLTVDSIDAANAHVSWNHLHATAYHLVINNDTNVMEYLVTDTTFLLAGLRHSTWYTVSVAGISDGDTGDYTTVQFHTLCATEELPYHENFEAPTIGGIPICWSASWDGIAARAPRVINTNDYTNISNIPDHALLMSAGYGHNAEVTLPTMGDDLQNISVAFDYRFENANRGILQLGYYENDSVFNIIQNMSPQANSYRRDTVSFSVASVPGAKIVLRWILGGSLYSAVAIDNIEVFHHVIYYDVTLAVNDETMGIASGGGTYAEGDIATIAAIPNEGYHFMYWNDGDTHAVRQIVVTSDTLFTAFFAIDTIWRAVSVTANPAGACEPYGSGIYADSNMVEIGYHMLDTIHGGHWKLLAWSDGGSGNPRDIFVTSDTAIVAFFEWVADSTEGINELSILNSQLSIYPNPARTNVSFTIAPFNSITAISILDMNGRIVYDSRQDVNSPKCQQIDVSTFSPGLYFLRITTSEGTFARKLIIQ